MDKERIIKYCKLIGIVLSSLIIGLSIFYLIVNYNDWFVYVPFLLFGIIFVYIFIKIKVEYAGKEKIIEKVFGKGRKNKNFEN